MLSSERDRLKTLAVSVTPWKQEAEPVLNGAQSLLWACTRARASAGRALPGQLALKAVPGSQACSHTGTERVLSLAIQMAIPVGGAWAWRVQCGGYAGERHRQKGRHLLSHSRQA